MMKWMLAVAACGWSCSCLSAEALVVMREQNNFREIVQMTEGEQKVLAQGEFVLYPDISSDGRYVAYSEGQSPQELAIVLLDSQTGEKHVWEKTPGMNLHADFSGNGQKLAFSGPDSTGKQAIHVLEKESQGLSLLKKVETPHNAFFPALSSHGDFVVFHQSQGETKYLSMYDFAANKLTDLTDTKGYAMEPSLSFDDRQVVFSQKSNEQWDLYLLDLVDHSITRLTNSKTQEFAPTFTAGGNIVFASDVPGTFGLYQITAASLKNKTYKVEAFHLEQGKQLYSPNFSGDLDFHQALLPSFPEPARSSFGAARIGNKIFIAGGHHGPEHTYPPESFLTAVEYYDIDTMSWHKTTPLLVARQGFDLVAHDHALYLFGGFTYSAEHKPGWKTLDTIERYDLATKEWQTVGRLPRPRSSHVAAKVGTKVYLVGGWDSTPKHENDYEGKFHDEIDVVDLETLATTTLTARLPSPKRRAISAVIKDGEILVIGGISEGSQHFNLLARVDAFDPQTESWRQLPDLPFATFAPAAGLNDNKLYVFGGMFNLGEMSFRYVPHVYEFDFGKESWRHTGRYLHEAKGFSQVIGDDKGFYILGGHTYLEDKDTPVATMEFFGEQ